MPSTSSDQSGIASLAAAQWLADPAHRDARVRKLLDEDESAIVLPAVFQHLHLHRQEWLDPFLERRSLSGRFTTGRVVYVLPAVSGFHRWLPRQQTTFSKLHREMAAERKRSMSERVRSVQILARMPVHGVDDLTGYLTTQSEVAIVEAALGALVWLDEPTPALPVLLANLDDSRARVAMYAMPKLARLVPKVVLEDALAELLARPKLKVTVHKEALRLLGGNRSERALQLLLAAWRVPKLHRDVAIAALHGARRWLDREEAWGMLEAALHDPGVSFDLRFRRETNQGFTTRRATWSSYSGALA